MKNNLPLSTSLRSPIMFDPFPTTQFPNPNPSFPIWNHDQNQESGMESDNSGVNSPPLWKNSPSPSRPLLDCPNSLSPNSRAQAIARGQWELMEMVKNMPESSYELSLKDLVEHHRSSSSTAAATSVSVEQSHKEEMIRVMKRQESCRKAAAKFEDKGLFLNVAAPFSIKSRKKEGEKDWWKKKKFTGSSDSDSSRTTTTSASSGSSAVTVDTAAGDAGRRKRNGSRTGCCPIFQTRKSKKPVE